MRQTIKWFALVSSGFLATGLALAQAPADAPAGSTGLCRDGSYWTGPTKKGACRGHKGVQTWYASTDAASGGAAAAPTTVPAAATATTPNSPAVAASSTPTSAAPPVTAPKAGAAPLTAAAGGGPGLVWVNSKSNVYHCPSDKWYGKTKSGAYMSEADAIAKGNHADHGKACGK